MTSVSALVSFTEFDRLDLLTQPVMVVAGSKAGSLSRARGRAMGSDPLVRQDRQVDLQHEQRTG